MVKGIVAVTAPAGQAVLIRNARARGRFYASLAIIAATGVFLFGTYGNATPLKRWPALASVIGSEATRPQSSLRAAISGREPSVPVAAAPVHDFTIPPVTDGLAPVVTNFQTAAPIVFLGIDDGANKQPFELQLLKRNHIKATLFLADLFIKDNPAFFKDYQAAGYVIEDHSVDHELMSKLTYEQQKYQICTQADLEQREYGRRPVLFRPPGGDYNQDTRRAAADCGMKAVVNWIAKANGGSMQYQIGDKLRPGDIVLMHFRPEFAQDLQAFIKAQDAAGLHTELLEDWLPQT